MLRAGIVVALIGFLGIAFLLATDHFGRSIQVANFLFFLLLVLVLIGLITNETNKG